MDTPGSVRTGGGNAGWSISTMLALVLATVFFPPVGLVFGVKGMLDEETKAKASVLLTIAVFMTLMWAALILGL
ncbi:MAG: hypothetical protein PHE55_03025 [Methylococcaceae bacterium]|nr:hypothetical protein [Methylococcaceae bacterium]